MTAKSGSKTGLTSSPLGDLRKGKEEEIVSVPGLHADVDWKHPCHKKAENLPPTFDDALDIILAAPLTPTVIVNSGHGLQPYWLFQNPADTSTVEARLRIKGLLTRWQAMLRTFATARQWMLARLAVYQRDGLKDPACVTEANREYRDDSDTFGMFLTECTQDSGDAEVTASELYRLYGNWCKTNGMSFPLTKPVFGKKMKQRRYMDRKGTGGQRRWKGLELLPNAMEECAARSTDLW